MKNKESSSHINRKMSDDTYKLRRMVINYVYDAGKILDLPRMNHSH